MLNKISLIMMCTLLYFNVLSQDNSSITIANSEVSKLVTNGTVVGLVAGCSLNGDNVFLQTVGYRNLQEKMAYNESTLSRTASIAKPMTAIAIMQLVEKGLIDLDLPIQKYLPNYPTSNKGNITTRHLLSHTSGLDGYKSAREAENKTTFSTLADAAQVFQERPLRFTPGSDFYYSTYGYVVLGLIIESVSGLSFENYMQENIWDKADMRNTGIERFNESYENKSELYHSKKGKIKRATPNNLSNRIPGGGLHTTLKDMLKFGEAVLDNSLISEATLTLMTQNHSGTKNGNPYGFGWFLYGQSPNEGSAIGHEGEQTGSASQLMIIPKEKLVVIVLSNTSGTWKQIINLSTKLISHCRKMP